MKILCDPVYTARPSVCSTSYLFWQIIEGLIERHDDWFFYLLHPTRFKDDEEQIKFLDRHPDRVKLFPMPYQTHDRVEELFKVSNDMIHMIEPGISPVWDFDVFLTSRIPQLSFLRAHTNREVSFGQGTYRGFFGLEEMPVYSFRESVSWAPMGRMDLQSLAAYSQSDGVVINNLYVKQQIGKLAKEYLTPSTVLDMLKKVHEALPVKLERLADNPKPVKKEINMVFAGRMTGTRNFKEIAQLFREQFAYPLGKNKVKTNLIVSTHSLSTGSAALGEIDFIDIQQNNRDQFWKLLKEQAHVVINLSPVEDFSLSTYEPLLFGVPVIVPDTPWTSFLGPDYPFRVEDHAQAYAILKEFTINYDAMYAKFRKWEKEWWKGVVEGPRNQPTVDVVERMLIEFDAKCQAYLAQSDGGEFYKKLVREIEEEGYYEIDAMAWAQDKGIFVCPNVNWRNVPVGRRPNMILLKKYLNQAGWRDTLEVGVFTKE